MAVLNFWPPRSRSRLRSKSRSDISRDCLGLLPCKIWRSYLENWPSYGYLKNSTSEVEVEAEVKIAKFCQNLFGLSTRTSMRNLDSVTQEMSELCCSALMLHRQSVRQWVSDKPRYRAAIAAKNKINEFSHQLWVLCTCFYVIHIIEPRPLCIFLK